MDFSLTEDQIMTAASIRQMLAAAWPRENVRAYAETAQAADDSPLWQELTRSEFHTILVPEEFGGGGATLVDVMPVMEQFGYALAPSRFTTSAVISTFVVSLCEDSALKRSLLDGDSKLCTIQFDDLEVARDGENLNLTGYAHHVPDAQGADYAIVLSPELVSVVHLASAPSGVSIEPIETVDATRRVAGLRLFNAVVTRESQLAPTSSLTDLVERTKQVRMLGTICDCLGGAQRALDMAVEYSKQRHQFDRPIGSFQSLQHLMADAYVAVENLRSATWYAAHAIEHQSDDVEFAVLAASVLASKTYLHVSDLNIQIHGGMGFTKEVDAYLYAARAKVNEVLDRSLAHRVGDIASWLRTAELEPLVEYLGGHRRQLQSSMFANS